MILDMSPNYSGTFGSGDFRIAEMKKGFMDLRQARVSRDG
jgi:hypothetical protein